MDTVKDLTDNKQWSLDEFRANTGYKGTPQWVEAKLYDDRSVMITWQNTGADYYTFYMTGFNQTHSYNTTLLNPI